jgi:DNA adenine methylase
MPQTIERYFEPFIGGGAVFFALASQRRFRSAVIGDRNEWLTEAYRTIRDRVAEVVSELKVHEPHATDAGYYYSLRSTPNQSLGAVRRTAKLIFLNKTCFNGLFRVNRRGDFNVPFGKYRNPRVLDEENLLSVSLALQGVDVVTGDFDAVVGRVAPGDCVYLDPPYVPLSRTSSFTSYHEEPFGTDEQIRLAASFERWATEGATCVLSNSDCEFTRRLFADFESHLVQASRAINCVGEKRGKISELVVLSKRRALSQPRKRPIHRA